MHISVLGCGYVGLVTAACLAEMGHTVRCHDVDSARLRRLQGGELPLYEPGLGELVQQNSRAGRLHFDADLATCVSRASLCFIAVGTPPDAGGAAELAAVQAACDALAAALRQPTFVVIKSTVPPGTHEALQARLDQALRGRQRAEVISNPEFLKEGMAVEDFRRPDRIVVGVRSAAAEAAMRQLYAPFLRNGHPLMVMTPRSAELSKYASNIMLAARISMMNELAHACDAAGADIAEVRRVVGADHRIGSSYLYAGLGYGGSCFPKDVRALDTYLQAQGRASPLLRAVQSVNHSQQICHAESLARQHGGDLTGVLVAVWGLAFKPRTDDVREAPALAAIRHLLRHGAAVRAHDPVANAAAAAALGPHAQLQFETTLEGCLPGADALLVCTEWDVFRTPDFAQMRRLMRTPRVFDGRNLYAPPEVRGHGLSYEGIGRKAV